MKNLKAKQGYWLSKVNADGTHIFSQDIYAPDTADLSEWQEIEDVDKRRIEAEELQQRSNSRIEPERVDYGQEMRTHA